MRISFHRHSFSCWLYFILLWLNRWNKEMRNCNGLRWEGEQKIHPSGLWCRLVMSSPNQTRSQAFNISRRLYGMEDGCTRTLKLRAKCRYISNSLWCGCGGCFYSPLSLSFSQLRCSNFYSLICEWKFLGVWFLF